jgi:hypothetical protein
MAAAVAGIGVGIGVAGIAVSIGVAGASCGTQPAASRTKTSAQSFDFMATSSPPIVTDVPARVKRGTEDE